MNCPPWNRPSNLGKITDELDDEDENEMDAGPGAFELLGRRKRKKKKSKDKKPVSLRISLSTCTKDEECATQPKEEGKGLYLSVAGLQYAEHQHYSPISDDIEEENDPLDFFSECHEGQDPAYAALNSLRMKERLSAELAKLDLEQKEDMAQIETYLAAKWEDRNETLQKEIKNLRIEMIAKQKKQRTQLAERHRAKLETDQKKIEEGMKWLTQRQRLELERKLQQHQQDAQQRGVSREQCMLEWNKVSAQLQSRQAHQMKQFESKKVTMSQESEQELKSQTAILEAHHKKRQAETDQYVEELGKKCQKIQEKLKAKLSRLHEERFLKRRDEVKRTYSDPVESSSCQRMDEVKGDVNPNNFVDDFHELKVEYFDEQAKPNLFRHIAGAHEGAVLHDAIQRQKRRKNVMNGAAIQLAVEIHNEGIIMMSKSSHHDDDILAHSHDNSLSNSPAVNTVTSDKRTSSFIPWGAQARSLLYSIVCGEIPSDGFDRIDSIGQGAMDGGLVKCMITDMRTSEESAMLERADSLVKFIGAKSKAVIEDLERKHSQTCALVLDLEAEYEAAVAEEEKTSKAHRESVQQHDKAKSTLDKFQNEAQRYFNNDGVPSEHVNPGNQQKLLTAMYKFKGAYEASKSREEHLREPLEKARSILAAKKEELEKARTASRANELALKKARRNSTNRAKKGCKVTALPHSDDFLNNRIESVIASIRLTADKRREQVNRKKSNSGYNAMFVKSVSNASEDMKRSLWQKMQRRRITTMLRPSHPSLIAEVKRMAKGSNSSCEIKRKFFDVGGEDEGLDSSLRAEQLLLLALHPEAPDPPLPAAPSHSSPNQPWAEPGWHVVLNAPIVRKSQFILPIDPEGHLLRTLLSECASSSGRHVGSLIKSRHLRMLTAPLSSIGMASAPAENPAGHQNVSDDMAEIDPLSTSENKMAAGYRFAIRPTISHPDDDLMSNKELLVTQKNPPAKRRRSSKVDKVDAEVDPPNRRRKFQTSKKSQSPTHAPLASPEVKLDPTLNAQIVSQAKFNFTPFQQAQVSEAASTANTNIFNHQLNLTQQQALFLMQQQQNQAFNTPPSQPNFPPSQLQQQQQFQHMMQMRMLAQARQRQFSQQQPQDFPGNPSCARGWQTPSTG